MESEQHQQRAPWADAPPEVLGLVVGRLPTLADCFRFGAVCRPWHAAERQLPRPKQLPWLALSLPASATADRAAFYNLSDKAVYDLPFPAGGGARARICGSSDDWLVLAHGERGNFLFNPFTGATLALPHQRTITRCATRCRGGRRGKWVHYEYYPRREEPEPYIRKAVLSCRPSMDDPGRCIVAAIADSGDLFFCRPGQSSWRRPKEGDGSIFHFTVSDIVFHNGRLYAIAGLLNYGDTMRVLEVDDDAGELVSSGADGAGFILKLADFKPDELRQCEIGHERRYFVESRGRLLLVERYFWSDTHGVRRTYLFKVFRRTPVMLDRSNEVVEPWMPLESLDGEVLFLGASGSRSFAASEHGGDDADCIYFTDDHYLADDSYTWHWQSDVILDDWSSSLGVTPSSHCGGSKQRCHDIGRYCMRDKSVTFLKDLAPNERRSPPTWLYLSERRR
ncbi:hypothetical protein ACP70R_038007 [Stipagrostis hirtigluma subsp. patula]